MQRVLPGRLRHHRSPLAGPRPGIKLDAIPSAHDHMAM